VVSEAVPSAADHSARRSTPAPQQPSNYRSNPHKRPGHAADPRCSHPRGFGDTRQDAEPSAEAGTLVGQRLLESLHPQSFRLTSGKVVPPHRWSILGNGVDLIFFGIPPISAKNAGMDGARKSIPKGKML
jgi:hypothetical protein